MPSKLDYGATVPIDERAPFSVKVDPNTPPGQRFVDYKPSKAAANASSVVVKADDTVRKKNFMRPPVSRNLGSDYINPEDSAIRRGNDKSKIVEIAKAMYLDEKNKRINFERAAALVKAHVEGQEETPELLRARKIVERGAPLTKEQAMEKAAEQFYGLRS